MELLTQADEVVRRYLPQMLEAAGEQLSARNLRRLEPIEGTKSIIDACGVLQEIRDLGTSGIDWEEIINEAAFWCEAAVLAAVRADTSAFHHHVKKASCAMTDGLRLVSVH